MFVTKRHIHILLAAGLLVALVPACTKNEIRQAEDMPLDFGTYSGRATRADGTLTTTNALPSGSSFKVFGLHATTKWTFDGTNASNFMTEVEVTYDGTNYSYSPLRYWPKDDGSNFLTFWAFYPAGDANVTSATNNLKYTDSLTYKVPADLSRQSDLMLSEISSASMDLTYSTTASGYDKGTVVLTFRHQLSKIEVRAKLAKDTKVTKATIDTVRFRNIESVGTLTTAYSAGATTRAWKSQSVPVTYSDSNLVSVPDTNAVSLTKTPFLLLPQSLTADTDAGAEGNQTAVLEVAFTIYYGNNKSLSDHAIINLGTVNDASNVPIEAWEMNKQYVYTLVLGGDSIVINADTVDWLTGEGGNATVEGGN